MVFDQCLDFLEIVFGNVRGRSEIINTIIKKIWSNFLILTSVIGVNATDFKFEIIFNNCLEMFKGIKCVGFAFEWNKPYIMREMINKNNVVLKKIIRLDGRCPYITIKKIQQISIRKCIRMKREFVALVRQASRTITKIGDT